MNNLLERPMLLPNAAIELWLAGIDAWNDWVFHNPNYDICFQGIDFSQYQTKENPGISFKGFHFGNGVCSFHGAKFGDFGVSFSGAHFTECKDVLFSEVSFGAGNINFSDVYFGESQVNFEKADFSKGTANFVKAYFGGFAHFEYAKFRGHRVDFSYAKFKAGTSFSHAEFGNGGKAFVGTKFGEGTISFVETKFGDGDVDFNSSEFTTGELYFIGTTFGLGTVSFFNSKLGDVNAYFTHAQCHGVTFNFENLSSRGRFELRNIVEMDDLNLKGASFENALSIVNVHVWSIPDLVNTKLSNQLSLHSLSCELNCKRYLGIFQKAVDTDDIERGNRLKELAEDNKHHSMALHFHAIELRAKRWQSQSYFRSSMMDLLFDKLCNYGQSVSRPLTIWVMLTILCAIAYGALFKTPLTTLKQGADALIFSFTNSLPFLNTANEGRKAMEPLFESGTITSFVLPLMMIQGVLSVLMLFLLGLGLRNRFRI
jgi:uncharacterized protein YjbI with pentapeptide repeats